MKGIQSVKNQLAAHQLHRPTIYARRFNLVFTLSPLHKVFGLLGLLLLSCSLVSCKTGKDEGNETSAPPVVKVTAVDYAFAAPDTIPAGWVTFRMPNKGTESHHFHLDRLPEGRTFPEWREAFDEPADSIMQLVAEGKIDSAKAGEAIERVTPDWAALGDRGKIQTQGGVGLVAPGHTGQATHKVEPGHYVMICVIDAPSGRIHASLGMVSGLVAVDSSVGQSPPSPDVTVQAEQRSIRMKMGLKTGKQTIGFRVEEVPEELKGGTDGYYGVWLTRLNDTTGKQEISEWDYQNPTPYESLGGFEYLPPNQTAYMTANLKSGRYAWIWFYQGMDLLGEDQPLIKEFTVK